MSPGTIPGVARLPSPRERHRRNRAEMSAHILDIARSVMRQQGVASLTLNEIARQVGIRTQSLYEYFPNKAALYDTLFLIGVRLFREELDRAAQAHPPGWDRVRAWFEHYMTFAQENPDLYQLVFERPVPGFVPSETSMAESQQMLASGVQATADMAEAGLLAPGLAPAQATDLFIALMHGLTALHMANEPHLPAGTGRFGGLVPAAIALFEAAQSASPAETATADGAAGPAR